MYCKNCGSEIADGAKFCSQCGTPLEAVPQQTTSRSENFTAAEQPKQNISSDKVKSARQTDNPVAEKDEKQKNRKTSFEEFQWNVSDYPTRNSVEKTEDIDFNWSESPRGQEAPVNNMDAEVHMTEGIKSEDLHTLEDNKEEVLKGGDLESSIFGNSSEKTNPDSMSAAERIDKFYTFNRKNEEFQQLLDKEYNKVKSGNAIGNELSKAEELASERFHSRPVDSSMEAFLESEGIVKPYQPKAFESDVLQRIEAQEAEKEAKRLEEEARLAAIEAAKKEAEAEKLREEQEKAAEEARLKAAEEARIKAEIEAARLEEIAKAKAAEEARLAEEARIRAEEEAKRRAEEEIRLKAEAEARQRAEAEARVKAEEEARLAAEADLRAAQEAAKIRAQQEARLAAEAEAKFHAEQERRRLADIEAQKRLEEERKKIAQQANQAVAAEEARKVLEQTARMREEEAAKIKAAVAGLRADASADRISENIPPIRKEVEEAHRATKNQIDEMAKARTMYFAEYEEENKKEDKPVTGRDTLLTNDLSRTRTVDKKAILAGLNDDTTVVSKSAIAQEADKAETAHDEDEDFFRSLNAAAAAGGGAAAGIAAAEAAKPIDFKDELLDAENDSVEELHFEDVNDSADMGGLEEADSFESLESIDDLDDIESLDDMDGFSENVSDQTQVFSQDSLNRAANADNNSVLQDTVVMQKSDSIDAFAANDFDNYGNEEAQNYIQQQGAYEQTKDYSSELGANTNTAMDRFYDDDFDDEEQLSKKELKQREKEQKRLEKQRAKEEKRAKAKKGDVDFGDDDVYEDDNSGGKGRIALKVILIILVVILAVEVVGMGIRFIAPQSKAAEFIDSQLNKVIQLITGDDTEYSVIAAQVRTEPMEDKTDLINSQKSKNKDGNIKSIVYSSDLGYDDERDGKVSDLVLSQPMTQVEWGRDKDNYPVYYDEQVVGRIIAFESQKLNLMNKGDEKVLDMIDSESALYGQVSAMKNQKASGEFSKLEIGEIRQAGSSYCVWVRETIGGTTTERVYSMYAEKEFVLKLSACYDV